MLLLYVLGFVSRHCHGALPEIDNSQKQRSFIHSGNAAYRWPTMQSLGLRLIDRGKVFLRRAGTVILAVAIGLWVLAHLASHRMARCPEIEDSFAGMIGKADRAVIKPLGSTGKSASD